MQGLTAAQPDLRTALATARRMGCDPELESIAGEAAWYAAQTYDPSRCNSLAAWTVFVVRTRVWTYWRACRSRPIKYIPADALQEAPSFGPLDHSSDVREAWGAHNAEFRLTDEDPEPCEYDADFCLLTARYVDGVAEWSLARMHGVSTSKMHRRIAAARARFLQSVGAL